MDKRILIFSSDPRDQEEIALTIEDYFKHRFKRFLPIEIQKFFSLSDSSNKGYSIGKGGEILIVFDRRLCSDEGKRISFEEGKEKESLTRLALKMSKEYCTQMKIPYILYEGEIRNRAEDIFIAKIEEVKSKLGTRLEEKI